MLYKVKINNIIFLTVSIRVQKVQIRSELAVEALEKLALFHPQFVPIQELHPVFVIPGDVLGVVGTLIGEVVQSALHLILSLVHVHLRLVHHQIPADL